MSTVVQPTTRRWVLDPAGSTVEFRVRTMWGLQGVTGRFGHFAGEFVEEPTGPAIRLTVDADSIDTGNVKRDEHLKGADFFDVGEFPQVRFASTDISQAPDGSIRVRGVLEAGGVTQPVDVSGTITELGEDVEIEGTTVVDHRAFGMSDGVLAMIRPSATLHVVARLHPSHVTD